jgi:hypothetical protein
VENCDRHLLATDILRLFRRHLAPIAATDIVNSAEYTDEWSTAA